jgi:hypothetical protein
VDQDTLVRPRADEPREAFPDGDEEWHVRQTVKVVWVCLDLGR